MTVSAAGEKRLVCGLNTIDKGGVAQASFMVAIPPPLDTPPSSPS
jgi:hypothetical protein